MKLYSVKLVPVSEPNHDGRWTTFRYEPEFGATVQLPGRPREFIVSVRPYQTTDINANNTEAADVKNSNYVSAKVSEAFAAVREEG